MPPVARKKVSNAFDTWAKLLDETDLTVIQKSALKTRVISVVDRLRIRLRRLSATYTCLRTTTSIGSLLVPSILTLQSPTQPVTPPSDGFSAYWAIWGIGLVVSISNAFVSLFRVDKNYYTVGNLLEKIESEAWLFLTQSGPYYLDDAPMYREASQSGHRESFTQFIEKCEILINKAVRSEYTAGFKQHPNQGGNGGGTSSVGAFRSTPVEPYLREAPGSSAVVEMYTNPRTTIPANPVRVPGPAQDPAPAQEPTSGKEHGDDTKPQAPVVPPGVTQPAQPAVLTATLRPVDPFANVAEEVDNGQRVATSQSSDDGRDIVIGRLHRTDDIASDSTRGGNDESTLF